MDWILLATSAAPVALVLVLALWIGRIKSQHQRSLNSQQQAIVALKKHLSDSLSQLSQKTNEVDELRSGMVSLSKRIQTLEKESAKHAQSLTEALNEVASHAEPEAKLYSRAVKMIELGADLDEVMRECELPQGEAELLFSMHQK